MHWEMAFGQQEEHPSHTHTHTNLRWGGFNVTGGSMNIVLVGGHGDAGSVHPAWVTWPQRSEEDTSQNSWDVGLKTSQNSWDMGSETHEERDETWGRRCTRKQLRHGVKDTWRNSPDMGSKTQGNSPDMGSKTHKETAQTWGPRHTRKQSRHGVQDTQGNSPDMGSKTLKETVQIWGQRHNFLKHNSQRTRTH